jgi:type III secretion protein C
VNTRLFRGCIPVVLGLTIGLGAAGWSHAAPPTWADAPYSYYSNNKPLSGVLREFAAGFSLGVSMPKGLDQAVNGRFNARNPTEFMDRIAGVYGLNWYVHSGVLEISRTQDNLVKAVAVPSLGGNSSVRQVLIDLQVFEPRFGWSEMPEQGFAMVSGPKTYVEMIERTIAALPKAPGGQQVVMFRLRHASVDDRSIMYRDREITVPGVATVLRNLMQFNTPGLVRAGSATGGASSTGNSAVGAGSTGVGMSVGNPPALGSAALGASAQASSSGASAGQGGAGMGSAAAGAGAAPGGPTSVSTQTRPRPSIQSDSRLNAIIVQDAPDRIPLYASLIAQMDVPSPLIEIEALIVDVNTTRLQELGIAWGARMGGGNVAAGFGDVTANPDPKTLSIIGGSAGTLASPTATVLDNAGRFLVARLRALEEQGDASIQARPSILTSENIGAVIDLSETVYIQTTSERTALVTPVTAGTTLRVTPRLFNRGDAQAVFLTVDIEDGQVQPGSAGALPTVRKGVVSTEASLGMEESLLIGGYNSIQTVVGSSKIPLLGSIPGLGALFSSRSNSVQRRERLFLLKTRVVSRGQPAANIPAAPPSLFPGTSTPATSTPPPAPQPAEPAASNSGRVRR